MPEDGYCLRKRNVSIVMIKLASFLSPISRTNRKEDAATGGKERRSRRRGDTKSMSKDVVEEGIASFVLFLSVVSVLAILRGLLRGVAISIYLSRRWKS